MPRSFLFYLYFAFNNVKGFKIWNSFMPFSTRLTVRLKESFNPDDKFGEIQIFTTVGCKYCRIAKAKLKEIGIHKYVEIDINQPVSFNRSITSNYSQMLEERLVHAKDSTVPQIYIGYQRIGGCNDLLGD